MTFIQPHNDDAVFSVGGTLEKFRRAGWSISYLYITDSSNAIGGLSREESKKIRSSEAKSERSKLDVTLYKELDHLDGGLTDLSKHQKNKTIEDIASFLYENKPDVVFIPSVGDLHPDHQTTHKMAISALSRLKPRPMVVFYFVWLLPNFFQKECDPISKVVMIGIDNEINIKRDLIRRHKSQIRRRRYDIAMPNLNSYFAHILKADKQINSRFTEILGINSHGRNRALEMELLDSLKPVMDISFITHGEPKR